MSHFAFKINWFDFAVLLLLAIGLIRGRKRGMSEEVLDLFKWVLIVIAAGHLYRPIGDILASSTALSNLTCYIGVYAFILIFTHGTVALIRRVIGQKIITSDAFGGGEYYMGMMSGAFRYFCIIIVALAFLNAKVYNADQIKADDAYWEKNLGSGLRPPSLAGLQRTIFQNSMSGSLAQNYLSTYLITPTAPQNKRLGEGKTIRGREKNFDEVLEKK